MDDDFRDLTRRKLSFFQTLKAIAWGFLESVVVVTMSRTLPRSIRSI